MHESEGYENATHESKRQEVTTQESERHEVTTRESKTAFTAVVGCPNAGKSSILNRLLGRKLSAVSPKAQTTRTKITGVLTRGETQLVFTDTPGFHRPKNRLGEFMQGSVGESISGVDNCLLVTEPQPFVRPEERELIRKFKSEGLPAVLAINKIDLIKERSSLAPLIAEYAALYDFAAVVPLSARSGEGIDILLGELEKLALPSVHYFPDDAFTDQPERVLVGEMIREKALLYLDREVPHGIAVSIEGMRERVENGLLDIDAVLYCEKESHKGIIIGKNGAMLKKILSSARLEAESFFGCKVNLKCHVKLKENWREREALIRAFGLDGK